LWKSRWGVNQWAAFFATQALPVMPKSRQLMLRLEANKGELLSPKELADLVLDDPLLCLRFLREAERSRSHRLENETTTGLAAILQLGVDKCRALLLSSKEIDETNVGLLEVAERSTTAAQLAFKWASAGMIINPEEVAMAALLADAGELLLWVYEPELAQAAKNELQSGQARQSAQAQVQVCKFDFRQLTVRCAEVWNLPSFLRQLLRGSESRRAQLVRLCAGTARHLEEASSISLAHDLVEVAELIPSLTLDWLAEGLITLPHESRLELLELARAVQAKTRIKVS